MKKEITSKFSVNLALFSIPVISGLILSVPVSFAYKTGALFLLVSILILISIPPFWILSFLFLLRPVQEYLFLKANLLKLVGGIMIFFAFFVFINYKGRFNLCWSKLKYFYLYLLVSVAGLTYTIDYSASITFILKAVSFISIYLLVFNLIQTKKDSDTLLTYFFLASILPLLYGFYQFATGDFYIMKDTGIKRVTSFFTLGNHYSHFLLVIFFASLTLYLNTSKKIKKTFISIVLLAMVIMICLLGVRSTWGVFFIMFLIMTFFIPTTRKYMILISPFIFILFMPLFIKGIESIFEQSGKGQHMTSVYARFLIWKDIILLVKKKFFLGYGSGTAINITKMFLGLGEHPHNDYLQIILENGIVGFIFYILFILSNLISSYRDIITYSENRYYNVCTFAFFFCYAILAFATNTFYNTTFIWYLMGYWALTYKLNCLIDKKK